MIFLLDGYNSFSMKGDSKQEQKGRLLKVKNHIQQKTKNKVFRIEGLSYREISSKIEKGFNLDQDKYYFLWYVDGEGDEISVDCQDDFDAFAENARSLILDLRECQIESQHFIKREGVQVEVKERGSGEDLQKARKREEEMLKEIQKLQNTLAEAKQTIQNQNATIKELKEISKWNEIDQKKKQLAEQLQQYKRQMQQKYKAMIQQKLKQLQLQMQAKCQTRPTPSIAIPEEKPKQQQSQSVSLQEILSIPQHEAEQLIEQHPNCTLQALVNLYLSK